MSDHSVVSVLPSPSDLPRSVSAVRAAMRHRVAVVQASAGWGKTTAVRRAIDARPHAWVDLSTSPRESGAFLFALAAALDVPTAPLGQLLSDARADGSVSRLIDWLDSHHVVPPLVVVDDLHLLADDRLSLDFLAALVKVAPRVSWVLLSRHRVSLPLSTWMAYGDAALPVTEDELRLDSTEVAALLARSGIRSDDSFVDAFCRVTGGWPVAAQFFLHAAERTADLAQITNLTKDVAFSYLADHAIDVISPAETSLLRLVAFVGSFDASMLADLGRSDVDADLEWLRAAPIPIVASAGSLRLHDLFSEYVRRTTPLAERTVIVDRVVDLLLVRRRVGDAFDLLRASRPDRLAEVLATHGFGLLDEGRWETASQLAQAVPSAMRQSEPGIVGLRAALAAIVSDFDRAESLYVRAIDLSSDPEMKSSLSRRLSMMYLNRADDGASRIIEPVLDIGSERSRCEARSVYAVALATAGNLRQAIMELVSALAVAEDLADDALIAKIYKNLAWVHLNAGEDHVVEADRYASQAARLSESVGDWLTYAAANSMLCSSASLYRDDPSSALWHAQQLVLGATRAGDRQKRSFGLWAQYEIEVDRGRRDRVESLERELDVDLDFYSLRDGFMSRFSKSVSLAWKGAFDEAVHKMEVLEGKIPNPSEGRCWRASLAFFEAFAGLEDRARASISAVGRRGKTTNSTDLAYEVLADLHAALAEVFLGRPSLALRRIPSDARRGQDRALATALRLMATQSALTSDSCKDSLDVLRAAGRDGFADMLLAAVRRRPKTDHPAGLTEAEMAVLRGLESGRTAKQIAESTGRSQITIRNQITSVCRKLGVSGQIEALAAARRIGVFSSSS